MSHLMYRADKAYSKLKPDEDEKYGAWIDACMIDANNVSRRWSDHSYGEGIVVLDPFGSATFCPWGVQSYVNPFMQLLETEKILLNKYHPDTNVDGLIKLIAKYYTDIQLLNYERIKFGFTNDPSLFITIFSADNYRFRIELFEDNYCYCNIYKGKTPLTPIEGEFDEVLKTVHHSIQFIIKSKMNRGYFGMVHNQESPERQIRSKIETRAHQCDFDASGVTNVQ